MSSRADSQKMRQLIVHNWQCAAACVQEPQASRAACIDQLLFASMFLVRFWCVANEAYQILYNPL